MEWISLNKWKWNGWIHGMDLEWTAAASTLSRSLGKHAHEQQRSEECVERRGHAITRSHSLLYQRDKPSSHRARPPCLLGMTLIDAAVEVAKLGRRRSSRHHHVALGHRKRPRSGASMKTGKRTAPVVPDHLQQIRLTLPTTETEQVTAQGSRQRLLDRKRQRREALAYHRVARRQPPEHQAAAGRNGNGI